jgi:amino acid adenylation domain-containing protein
MNRDSVEKCRQSDIPASVGAARCERSVVRRNQPPNRFSKRKCIHELFQGQATRTPDGIAAIYQDRELSYCELDERSNQLAHYLRKVGVGPETMVAICLERSLEMIIGLLATLKAGGAYVPMDPNYPSERLAFMLADTQAPIVLTEQLLEGKLPRTRAEVVCLDRDRDKIGACPKDAPPHVAIPTNLAYVIYTSGSTGKPKGVLIEHAGMVNLVRQHCKLYGTTVGIRVSQTANASFDSMGAEIWPALLSGATLCIASDQIRADPEWLQRWLIEQKISIAFTTTVLAEQLLKLTWPKKNGALRVLRFGGERFRGKRENRSYPFKIYNEYGPTEDTVWTTVAEVGNESDADSIIGRAIANHRTYVLDEDQNPAPVGQAGELYIGGIGLARGYLNCPELTAKKFIVRRLGGKSTERLYRTGDLVRNLLDGNLAFVGRADDQVKIRGYRIEPGEIEMVLNRHSSVEQCAVIAREDTPGEKRLIAYVVPRRGPGAEAEENLEQVTQYEQGGHGTVSQLLISRLRKYLFEKLPRYLVPSSFMLLDEMPLTPNGKLDRRKLPIPAVSGGKYVAPRTPLECKLAEIWEEVLELDRVGADDDFFALGGHSLSAVQLANRVRQVIGEQVSASFILQAPTVAELAEKLQPNVLTKVLVSTSWDEKDSPETKHNPKESCAREHIPRQPRAEGDRETIFPTSFAQQSVWLREQLRPESCDFNIVLAFKIQGELEIDTLARSFSFLTGRHEVLRTTFRAIDGSPMQIVAPSDTAMALPVFDLRKLGSHERSRCIRQMIQDEARTPFDLAQGPLFRARLIRTEDREHVLIVNLHHIIHDDWSTKILMQELLTAYAALAGGGAPELPALPIQYGDYAYWQRNLQSANRIEEQLKYWRDQLSDCPCLQLPTDRPLGREIPLAANEPVELSPELIHAVKKLSEAEKATLFMTTLAAFQVLLARYTQQDDIVVGTPIAIRGHAEIESLPGLFLNTLVLRTRLNGNSTFRELIQRVRKVTLQAYENQELPFEYIVQGLAPRCGPGRDPLFQVLFNAMPALPKSYSVGELTFDRIEVQDESALFDLTVNLIDDADGTHFYLNYNANLFDPGTVKRIAGHFRLLLERMVDEPDVGLWELPLLSATERHQILVEWNDNHRDYPDNVFLHQFVERQVERSPNAIAAVFEGQSLTYHQLNERANRLAHHLRRFGVGPDRIVGILAERSFEMWIGILAILKAGGAYLPLDPNYPPERLAFLLQDAEPVAILTQRHLADRILSNPEKSILLEQDFQSESDANPAARIRPENLVYVLYTSGSTGKPKGVLNSHGGLANWLCWMQELFPMSEQDAILQKSPYTFDVSVREFFLALASGARMVIAKPGLHGDSRHLVQEIQRHSITAIHFVPPMLSLFLENPDAKKCSSLRFVMCSGDALSFDLRDRFFAAFPHLELNNMWGATEHAPESTYYKCGREIGKGIVPVGRPGANTQLYILDRLRQPVPIGVTGEAYLGGRQTALGYLGKPELSAQKFVPNPFAEGMLYKTGDLGRFRPDGVMEFVGRADNRIKLRGFRVELGEIEAVLKKHPAVRDCVVVVNGKEGEPNNQLVAYVVAGNIAGDELRKHAQRSLPEYMVPTAFVFLERIPVTCNGKIDRSRLPEPQVGRSSDAAEPLTWLQWELVQIWQRVIGVERIGLEDDFFERGGNSLLAMRIAMEIEKRLGKRLALATLLEAPTIRQITDALQTQGGEAPWSPIVAIQPRGSCPPFFGIHTLSSDVMFYRGLAQHLGEEQPFFAIQGEGLSGRPIERTSIEDIARYYVDEVRRVQGHGPYYLGGYCIGGIIAFEMAQQLWTAGEEVDRLVLIETYNPESSQRSTYRARIQRLFSEAGRRSFNDNLHYFANRIQAKAKAGGIWLHRSLNQLAWRCLVPDAERPSADLDPAKSPTGIMLLHAQSQYQPRPYPGVITLFRISFADTSEDLGWRDIAQGGLEIHLIPGEHETIFEPQHLGALAEKLNACLRARLSRS